MLTLYQFNALSEHDKADHTWKHWVLVDDRIEKGYSILLYQLPAFYVEIWYSPVRNDIQFIKSFSSTDRLQAYLEKIDISDVDPRPDGSAL